MNRQKLILAILLVLLVMAIAYGFMRSPRQERVAKLKFQPGMAVEIRPQQGPVGQETRLRLELLDREPVKFSGFRRNIFRPLFYSEMKAAAMAKNLPRTAPPPPAPLPPPPPPEKTPAQVAMEEVGQYVYLGYLQKETRRTVFLSKNNQIFLVKKGDRMAGKYEVADISENAMTISLAPNGEQVVIPIQANRPMQGALPPGRGRR